MASSIDADYTKTFLFPPALEDFVPLDHPARFIRQIAETLLSKVELEWKDENGKGRPPFAAALLFRVWLYGYMHQIRTVRKLEAACREHVGLLWLTGLQTPDHNTLWRFWRLNRKAIKSAFREFVRLAAEQGMVGLTLHAVDGTKIQAQCSTRQAWSRRKIEKLLVRVDEQITKLESEIGAHVETDDEGYRLREELTTQQALRETVTDRLAVLDAHAADDLNEHEPDARLMKSGVGIRLGYNAQIVADEKSGMIVAEAVVTAPADQGQLLPMLDLVEEQLGDSRGYGGRRRLQHRADFGRRRTATAARDRSSRTGRRRVEPGQSIPHQPLLIRRTDERLHLPSGAGADVRNDQRQGQGSASRGLPLPRGGELPGGRRLHALPSRQDRRKITASSGSPTPSAQAQIGRRSSQTQEAIGHR